MSSKGIIRGLGVIVYSDNACTKILTSIDWGTLSPGDSSTYPVWVKTTGNLPSKLSLSTQNFIPTEASSSLILTWDYSGAILPVGDILGAVFTLAVSPSISGIYSFTFDIVIKATSVWRKKND